MFMQSNTRLILEFIAAWSRGDVDVFMSYIHPDCVLQRMPPQAISGKANIETALSDLIDRLEGMDVVVDQIGTSPFGAVLTERCDRFLIKGEWVEIPTMGTFELLDDKIIAWRDYFDPAIALSKLGLPAGPSA